MKKAVSKKAVSKEAVSDQLSAISGQRSAKRSISFVRFDSWDFSQGLLLHVERLLLNAECFLFWLIADR
jgi:hypothetical protein